MHTTWHDVSASSVDGVILIAPYYLEHVARSCFFEKSMTGADSRLSDGEKVWEKQVD